MPDIHSFSSQYPVLLFPVRVQTKFVRATNATATHPYELRVRFYPDQLGLTTHEPELTPAEIDDAQRYWQQPALDGAARTSLHSLPHWRALVATHGAPRALWIVRQLTPTNLAALTADLTTAPTFPTVPTATAGWTQPARSLVLPHHFSVVLYEQATQPQQVEPLLKHQLLDQLASPYNQAAYDGLAELIPQPTTEFLVPWQPAGGSPVITGNPITITAVGFTPGDTEHPASITGLDAANAWTVDFDQAVAQGMAVVIPLTEAQYQKGFKRLVVLGVREDAAAQPQQQVLQQVLQDHRFTDGFQLVPQGTPTNNTDEEGAGYSSLESYDADASFAQLTQSSPAADSDGTRFATALGLAPDAVAGVAHASGTDGQEAVCMNRALWPATYGYYLEEMLRPLLSLEAIDWVRTFFEEHVLARGPLPAFRVGHEPYGILPTTRFSTWQPPASLGAYGKQLHKILRRLDVTWTERLNQEGLRGAGLYPTTLGAAGAEITLPTPPTAHQNFLSVLGVEATSTEYYQRYLLGPALTGTLNAFAVAKARTIWASRQHPAGAFGSPEAPTNPLYDEFRALLDAEAGADPAFTKELGLPVHAWPRIFDQTLQTTFRQVAHAFADEDRGLPPLLDDQPFSETEPLRPVADGAPNYIGWLATASFDDIWHERLPAETAPPTALLYKLLRHAVLLQYWDAAMRRLSKPADERAEQELFNILQQDTARWEWLYEPVDGQPLYEHLRETHPGLQHYLTSVQALAELPTARLERLLAEHLDLGNYRLDAWKIAQVAHQLTELRQRTPQGGSYVGAFAWLEDLQPADQSVETPTGRFDPDNLGYIHAPSLNHGTAAAILRQGYKSRQMTTDPGDPAANRMAVNLSSERVRKALTLLEGIRAGQPLSVLLGQEFELALLQTPERVGGRPFSAYVPNFRRAFPQAAAVASTGQATAGAIPAEQAARQVVDGLALLQASAGQAYPYGVSDLPAEEPDADVFAAFIQQQLRHVADTLDALGDLTVGESIYQAVLGNADRAAGMLDGIAQGQFPVTPEVVHPPHTGATVTHRVLVHLPASDAPQAAWQQVPLTPRAQAEPRLNHWLAGFFGDPQVVTFTFRGAEGEVLRTLSLAQVGLQPIDLLYLLEPSFLEADATLDRLLRRVVATLPATPDTDAALAGATLSADSDGLLQLRRLLPLASRLRQLLGSARAALPTDLLAPSQVGEAATLTAVDEQEVEGRLRRSYDALVQVAEELADALATSSAPLTPAQAAQLSSLCYQVCLFGIPEAMQALAAEQTGLVAAAMTVLRSAQQRVLAAQQALAEEGSPADKYQAVGQAVFGATYRVTLTGTLLGSAATQYQQAVDPAKVQRLLRAHQDNRLVMQEWLQGIACVRDNLDQLDKVTLLNDLLWAEQPAQYHPLELVATQLSSNSQENDYWLGMSYPSNYAVPTDALSLVQVLPAGYDATAPHCALWLDEWTEVLPQPLATTAVTFHYDQPNTEAAQSVLLAVSPQASNPTGQWSFEDLLGAVNETLDMAKKRTVEPDSLAFTHLGTVLPALVAPVAQDQATFTLEF